MRCTHTTNVELLEFGVAVTSHIVEGVIISHDSSFGDYTGQIQVTCLDCGFQRRYGRNRPRWVQELFANVTTISTDEPLPLLEEIPQFQS
jgi:hypothetical protein